MISEEGEVRYVQVRRGIASVTEEAVRSVRTWKFEPAEFNEKAVTSRMTVAVPFNPVPPLAANVPLPPLIHQDDEARIQSRFQPPQVTRATFPTYPVLSMANGTVVLDVMISEEGEVRNVQVRRDIASITEEAVRSVSTWKLEPAKFNGKAGTSRMTVAVTFNPVPPFAANVPLPPLIHQDDEARIQSRFQPPQVTRATFPTYPTNALNPGTVILQVSIDEAGKAQSTKVLRDAPPFTTTSIQAIEDWRFMPATLDGKPVESKVVLVFCFRLPFSSLP
jgi:TonB family protein